MILNGRVIEWYKDQYIVLDHLVKINFSAYSVVTVKLADGSEWTTQNAQVAGDLAAHFGIERLP